MKKIYYISIAIFYTSVLWAEPPKSSDPQLKRISQDLDSIEFYGNDKVGYVGTIRQLLNDKEYNFHEGRRFQERIDIFSIMTGQLAIKESLQLETIRALTNFDSEKRDIPIKSLKRVQIKSHPFANMLKGKKPVDFELAKYSPEDFYHVHFTSFGRLFNFADYLNETGSTFLSRFFPITTDVKLKEKLLLQLALKENKIARDFYDLVIGEAAMVGSDPFLMSGSDISLIFRIKQATLFFSTIKAYRDEFSKMPGVVASTEHISGIEIHSLIAKDRSVHSFFAKLPGNVAIISNSKSALIAIIETSAEKRPSLAKALDYQYIRTIFTASEKTEDGFIYLSDSFIRRLISPEMRIQESRRMAESAQIAIWERFAIFYYHYYRKMPASLSEISALIQKINPENENIKSLLTNQSRFTLKPNTFFVASNNWGSIGSMTPLIERPIEKVSRIEKDNYEQFVSAYSEFWKSYFDPIGIRLDMKDGFKIQTCILPLIENSFYNNLRISTAFSAYKSTPLKQLPDEFFSFRALLNLDKPNLNQLTRNRNNEFEVSLEEIKQTFTGELQVFAQDALPLADFDSGWMIREQMRSSSSRHRQEYAVFAIIAWSLFHPLRISLPLRDTNQANRLLQKFSRELFTEKGKHRRRYREFDFYQYDYKDQEIYTFKMTIFRTIAFRFYYTIFSNQLHVTTTRSAIESLIDGNLSAGEVQNNAQLAFSLSPSRMKQERNLFEANVLESAKDASLENFATVKFLHILFPETTDFVSASHRYLGFKLRCPAQGEYSVSEKGEIKNSIFGSLARGVVSKDGKSGSGLDRFFSTEKIGVDLEFTAEGLFSTITIK